ncbi:MAG: anthranilate phosphoribosyltransferase [Candidatus Tritonobacter lacicola]|nr:anthranilate phosphoribosyltransferase [Candidatus Tritonobacter lacicola]
MTTQLPYFTSRLASRADLSADEAYSLIRLLASPDIAEEEIVEVLTLLHQKGETATEIASFAKGLRDMAVSVPIPRKMREREIIDVVGTGGGTVKTFNISTAAALLIASAGVAVAKHGNRAFTSSSGAADVLEALGLKIELGPEEVAAGLEKANFAFLFAPVFHRATARVARARRSIPHETIFNILGPLSNPASPSIHLIGVYRPDLTEIMASAAGILGIKRTLVVHGFAGSGGMDEVSPCGKTKITESGPGGKIETYEIAAADYFEPVEDIDGLRGGSAEENAGIILEVLSGRDRGPKRKAVLINAALCLVAAGLADNISSGIDRAAQLIDDGAPVAKIEELRALYRS